MYTAPPTSNPSFGDASMYSTAPLTSDSASSQPRHGTATPKILDLNRQLDVDKLPASTTDWTSWGQESNDTTSSGTQSTESDLWSSFKNKEQELRQKEQDRDEREARLAEERKRTAEELRQKAEEVKRQQREELERMRQHMEFQKKEQERIQDEEREAARKARQTQQTVDLGEQNEMMNFMDQFS